MTQTDASCCENCATAAGWTAAFDRADLARCRGCGGWSWTGDPPTDPEALYDAGYFNGREYAAYDAAREAHRRNFRRKLELVLGHGRIAPARVRLLELGCATGEFMRLARAAGVREMLGIEPSGYCREIAARGGFSVRSPSDPGAPGAIGALRPNLIVAWDVWEHLARPATAIDELLAAADEGVVVAISTVDAGSLVARVRGPRWRQFHPPTHLHYPTRRSLRAYLSARGLVVRHHRSFGYHRPLVEYFRGLGFGTPRAERGWGFPWTVPLYLNLWDIQLVIAARAP